jgi:hypothetical protein
MDNLYAQRIKSAGLFYIVIIDMISICNFQLIAQAGKVQLMIIA